MSLRFCLTAFFWFFFVVNVSSQKPVLDSSVFGNWPRVSEAEISRDGKYMDYYKDTTIQGRNPSLVVQAIHGTWKMFLTGIVSRHMLQDGRRMVFQNSRDSLYILQLGTEQVKYLGQVSAYELIGRDGKQWLSYASPVNLLGLFRLTLSSTTQNKEEVVDSVADYWFNGPGNVLVVKIMAHDTVSATFVWKWYNLNNGSVGKIWEGHEILNHSMSEEGNQLAFFTPAQGTGKYEIWLYREGMIFAQRLTPNGAPLGIDTSLRLENAPIAFSQDGKRIFFTLTSKVPEVKIPTGVQVDIWSYQDPVLKPAQLKDAGETVNYLGWMDIASGMAQRLGSVGWQVYNAYDLENCTDKVIMSLGGGGDDWWRGNNQPTIRLLSLDGVGQPLDSISARGKTWTGFSGYRLSPEEHFFLYRDPVGGDLFSYEISKGETRNLTNGLNVGKPAIRGEDLFITGWLSQDRALLIYDNWDIWQLDPTALKPPRNLTQGYGRSHHIRLRLPDARRQNGIIEIPPKGQLLLTGFDTATKYSGYYRIRLDKADSPALLTMGPYRYLSVVQAPGADACLVIRESATEAPNYYFTEDLMHFRQVTDMAPQSRYNWLTSELVTWPLPDGKLCQGMLFKPENLDVHKKYPLIVHYYETRSDDLYEYRDPAPTMDEINIPYFVSRGYVIFVPDIHYRFGYAGESAFASIVSGTRYICQHPWIDSTRMGLQGHSFGGYETNYVITHTNLFAAAEEGSGVSDMISDYNGIAPGGTSNQDFFELGQYRMHASLWENPDIFVKGSPIFNADKVTTPLLMMHNKQDDHVPWTQGVEFFSALRRCGKKAWMLQYDRGEHFVQPGEDALDYTIRIEQFFNYYLKGALPPKWMTEGVPARKKGVETGYELDTSGKVP